MKHHQIGAYARRASGNARPAMHKHLTSAFYGILDEESSLIEVATKILPWNIVNLQHFVFERIGKRWVNTSQCLQNMRDSM